MFYIFLGMLLTITLSLINHSHAENNQYFLLLKKDKLYNTISNIDLWIKMHFLFKKKKRSTGTAISWCWYHKL